MKMKNQMSSIKYIKEIDSLRAIAVLAVLLFHFKVPYFNGGFIGVDIFFVISGYLITSIIMKQCKDGTFTFKKFYSKRIRRLMPAFFTTALLTYMFAQFIFPESLLRDLSKTLVASVTSTSNIFFYFNTDYFSTENELRPLLHTWSLSVEEQFYLVWPLSLFLGLKFFNQKVFRIIFVAICFLSYFVGMAYITENPTANFFLLHTRIFEFGIGCAVPLLGITNIKNRIISKIVMILSMAAIFYGILSVDDNTPYPSLVFLTTSLGVIGVILSKDSGLFRFIFQNRFLQYTGHISYSLYLVHWPIFVFSSYYLIGEIKPAAQLFMLILSYILGALSYRFIENPLRLEQNSKVFKQYTLAVLAVCLIFPAYSLIKPENNNKYESDVSLMLESLKKENSLRVKYVRKGKCYISKNETLDPSCVVGSPEKSLVIGDSYAAAFYAGIIHSGVDQRKWDLAASSSCRPTTKHTQSNSSSCMDRNKKTFGNIENLKKYKNIILIGALKKSKAKKQIIEDVQYLVSKGVNVTVIGSPYSLKRSMVEILEQYGSYYSGDQIALKIIPQFIVTDEITMTDEFFKSSLPQGVKYISLLDFLCRPKCEVLNPNSNMPFIRDKGHLSVTGSMYLFNKIRNQM